MVRFRNSIDLEKWLQPPRPSNISERPRIAVIKDVATRSPRIYTTKKADTAAPVAHQEPLPFPRPDRDLILAI
jgi:hypothetical protein